MAAASPSAAPGPAPVSAARIVEIEKKVVLTRRTEELLSSAGFREAGPPQSIVDTYLDDPHCTLTRHNYWLRRRDAGWELKYPAAPPNAQSLDLKATGLSRYEELNVDETIVAALQQLYQRAPDPHPVLQEVDAAERCRPVCDLQLHESDDESCPSLTSLIRSRALFPVVHLRTTRRTMRYQPNADGATSAAATAAAAAGTAAAASTPAVAAPSPHPYSAFEVVLDEADYLRDPPGYEGQSMRTFRVAEVEIVLTDPSESDMRDAEARVAEFAAQLEPADDSQPTSSLAATADTSGPTKLPRGKVERFLALFRPWHYRMLVLQASAARQHCK